MKNYDSEYQIQQDILTKVGGDGSKNFDSQYSILLEILDKIEGGGGGGASIDDNVIALNKTWSSSKINSELGTKQGTLTAGSNISINASGVISASYESEIDDTDTASNKTWSSSKMDQTFATKQNLEDSDYVIAQAINHLDTDKQNKLTAGANIAIDASGVISAVDTTYSDATQSAAGLMSATDKTKLDGLSNYTLPTASANDLGGIKVGSGLSIDASGILSATGGVQIDDTSASVSTVYSSSKCESTFAKVVTLTQVQYDALVTKDSMTIYIISDAQ